MSLSLRVEKTVEGASMFSFILLHGSSRMAEQAFTHFSFLFTGNDIALHGLGLTLWLRLLLLKASYRTKSPTESRGGKWRGREVLWEQVKFHFDLIAIFKISPRFRGKQLTTTKALNE